MRFRLSILERSGEKCNNKRLQIGSRFVYLANRAEIGYNRQVLQANGKEDIMHEHERQFHIQCKAGDVGGTASCPVIPAAVRRSRPILTTR